VFVTLRHSKGGAVPLQKLTAVTIFSFMKLSHNYFVYIIECKGSFYYVGITNNLEERLWQHNEGINKNCFTYKRRPVVLKYFEQFSDVTQAIAREKQLKGWGRKKKEALFNENYDLLKELSQRKIKAER
jgi:putative endonuclease